MKRISMFIKNYTHYIKTWLCTLFPTLSFEVLKKRKRKLR